MATVESDRTQPVIPAAVGRIPELQAGDHLTRFEFERRYSAMPQVKKAELIQTLTPRHNQGTPK